MKQINFAIVGCGRISDLHARGAIIGHVSPEAAVGGPIGVVQEGDIISYSIPDRRIDLLLEEKMLKNRLQEFSPNPQKIAKSRSVLKKYRKLIHSSDKRAVF